jgi:hypothetical protein
MLEKDILGVSIFITVAAGIFVYTKVRLGSVKLGSVKEFFSLDSS